MSTGQPMQSTLSGSLLPNVCPCLDAVSCQACRDFHPGVPDTGLRECQLHYMGIHAAYGTNNKKNTVITTGFHPGSFVRLGLVVSFALGEDWMRGFFTYGLIMDALGSDLSESTGCVIMGPGEGWPERESLGSSCAFGCVRVTRGLKPSLVQFALLDAVERRDLLMEQGLLERFYSVWSPRVLVYNNLQALAWTSRGCRPNTGYLLIEEEAWAWNLQSALNRSTPLPDEWEFEGREVFEDVTGVLPARHIRLAPYTAALSFVSLKNKLHLGLTGLPSGFKRLFLDGLRTAKRLSYERQKYMHEMRDALQACLKTPQPPPRQQEPTQDRSIDELFRVLSEESTVDGESQMLSDLSDLIPSDMERILYS